MSKKVKSAEKRRLRAELEKAEQQLHTWKPRLANYRPGTPPHVKVEEMIDSAQRAKQRIEAQLGLA